MNNKVIRGDNYNYRILKEHGKDVVLGEGSFGKVYKGVTNDSRSIPVALKYMKSNDMTTIKRELHILGTALEVSREKGLTFMPEVYDIIYSNDGIYVAMELVDGYELFDFIKDARYTSDINFRNQCSLLFMQQLSEKLFLLHKEAGIIHRDIKPQNIMVTPKLGKHPRSFTHGKVIKYEAIFVDFGISCLEHVKEGKLVDMGCLGSFGGTAIYRAPEIYLMANDLFDKKNILKINQSSDIWSLGLTFYNLVTLTDFTDIRPVVIDYSERLYKSTSIDKTVDDYQHAIDDMIKINVEPVNTILASIISKMLRVDYRKRISVEDLVFSVSEINDKYGVNRLTSIGLDNLGRKLSKFKLYGDSILDDLNSSSDRSDFDRMYKELLQIVSDIKKIQPDTYITFEFKEHTYIRMIYDYYNAVNYMADRSNYMSKFVKQYSTAYFQGSISDKKYFERYKEIYDNIRKIHKNFTSYATLGEPKSLKDFVSGSLFSKVSTAADKMLAELSSYNQRLENLILEKKKFETLYKNLLILRNTTTTGNQILKTETSKIISYLETLKKDTHPATKGPDGLYYFDRAYAEMINIYNSIF